MNRPRSETATAVDRLVSERPADMDDLCARHRGILQGEVDWLLLHGHEVRAAHMVEVGVLLERWQRELRDQARLGPIQDEMVQR